MILPANTNWHRFVDTSQLLLQGWTVLRTYYNLPCGFIRKTGTKVGFCSCLVATTKSRKMYYGDLLILPTKHLLVSHELTGLSDGHRSRQVYPRVSFPPDSVKHILRFIFFYCIWIVFAASLGFRRASRSLLVSVIWMRFRRFYPLIHLVVNFSHSRTKESLVLGQ